MSFFIRDPATDEAVRKLAKLKNQTLTEAVRQAAENEYERARAQIPLVERLAEISRMYRETPDSGLKADKAFFDELSGDI
jgi:antitoxin VapB